MSESLEEAEWEWEREEEREGWEGRGREGEEPAYVEGVKHP